MVHGIIFDFNRTIYNPEYNKLIPGSREVLETLQRTGYKLTLLSKKTTTEREAQIKALGIEQYFMCIQIIEGSKTLEHFRKAQEAMQLYASEIAVVGDRVRSELVLGKRAGMKTIWYQEGKFATELPQNQDEQPDQVIHKLEEIFRYV